jgi:hypothetical protein
MLDATHQYTRCAACLVKSRAADAKRIHRRKENKQVTKGILYSPPTSPAFHTDTYPEMQQIEQPRLNKQVTEGMSYSPPTSPAFHTNAYPEVQQIEQPRLQRKMTFTELLNYPHIHPLTDIENPMAVFYTEQLTMQNANLIGDQTSM